MKQKLKKNDQDYSECVQDDIFVHYFKRNFMGHEISWKMNVFTGESEIEVNDEFAKIFGFESLQEMMLDDNVLDFANQIEQQTGRFPFKQNFGYNDDPCTDCRPMDIDPFHPPF